MTDEGCGFYSAGDAHAGSHLALRWKGRVRYIVPRQREVQHRCWEVFRPGALKIPLRVMARLPRLCGAATCMEGTEIEVIREAIGQPLSLSCSRAGAAGPWSKDTILFVDTKTGKPVCLVKAGRGEAVSALLENEAAWLQRLRETATLARLVPEIMAHCNGRNLSFVAQRPLSGAADFSLGRVQLDFLRKLQRGFSQTMTYERSNLHRVLDARWAALQGKISDQWSKRIADALQQIDCALLGRPVLQVAAHNDFTPWNICVGVDGAQVFDWEYAADEYLPLLDPLHFALLPMALKRPSVASMTRKMDETIRLCMQWLGKEFCNHPQAQALAYLVNVSTLYLCSVEGRFGDDPVVESYGQLIDHLCLK